jgi:hypothetical protein
MLCTGDSTWHRLRAGRQLLLHLTMLLDVHTLDVPCATDSVFCCRGVLVLLSTIIHDATLMLCNKCEPPRAGLWRQAALQAAGSS